MAFFRLRILLKNYLIYHKLQLCQYSWTYNKRTPAFYFTDFIFTLHNSQKYKTDYRFIN